MIALIVRERETPIGGEPIGILEKYDNAQSMCTACGCHALCMTLLESILSADIRISVCVYKQP